MSHLTVAWLALPQRRWVVGGDVETCSTETLSRHRTIYVSRSDTYSNSLEPALGCQPASFL